MSNESEVKQRDAHLVCISYKSGSKFAAWFYHFCMTDPLGNRALEAYDERFKQIKIVEKVG